MAQYPLVRPDGAVMVSPTGKVRLAEPGKPCCCEDTPVVEDPITTCGSNETCQKFCNPNKKSFDKSADRCGCPCSGHRDYPTMYHIEYSGLTLRTGVKIRVGDGTWVKITAAGSFGFRGKFYTDCADLDCQCLVYTTDGAISPANPGFGDHSPGQDPYTPITYDVYEADGTTLISSGNAGYIGGAFSGGQIVFGTVAGGCGYKPDRSKIYVTMIVVVNSSPAGREAAVYLGGEALLSEVFPTLLTDSVSRCYGGTLSLHPYSIQDSDGDGDANPEGNEFGGDTYCATAGTLTITPACSDCNEEPLDQTGDPPERCGQTILVSLDIFVDSVGDYVHFDVTLTKDGAQWDGTTTGDAPYAGQLISIFISARDTGELGDKCCPDLHAYTDCENCSSHLACDACWRMTIAIEGGTCFVHMWAHGPCPPADAAVWLSGLAVTKTDISDGCSTHDPLIIVDQMTVGYVEDCPP